MALPPFVQSIISWVRAGYPEGVPEQDYIALFALLGSQLTDADVQFVADELASTGDEHTSSAIKAAIADITHDKPLDADVARVRARLAGGGWPLADPKSA
jgi:hypothetical protein